LIYYNWRHGLVPSKIVAEMNSTLGKDTTNERTFRSLVAKFKAESVVFEDEDWWGRRSNDINDQSTTADIYCEQLTRLVTAVQQT
jgi:hypothetical protein